MGLKRGSWVLLPTHTVSSTLLTNAKALLGLGNKTVSPMLENPSMNPRFLFLCQGGCKQRPSPLHSGHSVVRKGKGESNLASSPDARVQVPRTRPCPETNSQRKFTGSLEAPECSESVCPVAS